MTGTLTSYIIQLSLAMLMVTVFDGKQILKENAFWVSSHSYLNTLTVEKINLCSLTMDG